MPVRRIRIEDIRVDDLSLADDFAFRVAMKDNTEAVQHIVRTILSRGDIIIRRVRVQDVQESRETHEARLDLLAEDGEGNKIDIEMQKIGKRSMKWLVKRSVYYLGLLITRTLHKKEEYSRARDAIVIFIVDRDIIGKGRAVYSYSLRSDEDNVKLKHAGARIVIANGTYSDDEGSAISEMYRDIYEKDLGKCTEGGIGKGERKQDSEKEFAEHHRRTLGRRQAAGGKRRKSRGKDNHCQDYACSELHHFTDF